MPKRECPFANNFLPQLKIHVSDKKYNLKDEKQMSQIHGKFI